MRLRKAAEHHDTVELAISRAELQSLDVSAVPEFVAANAPPDVGRSGNYPVIDLRFEQFDGNPAELDQRPEIVGWLTTLAETFPAAPYFLSSKSIQLYLRASYVGANIDESVSPEERVSFLLTATLLDTQLAGLDYFGIRRSHPMRPVRGPKWFRRLDQRILRAMKDLAVR
jgi:hypothetical protein